MSSYFEKLPYNQKKALSDFIMVVCSKIDRTIFNNKEKLYDFLYDVRYNYDCALDAQTDEEDAIYQAAREHGKEYQQLVDYLAMMFENFPGLYHDIDCILNLFYTALEKFSMSENTQTMALREAKSILERNGYMLSEADDGTWRSAVELCINYKGMNYSTLRKIRDMFETMGGEECMDYIDDALYGCTMVKVGLKDKIEKIRKINPLWYRRIKVYNNAQLRRDITDKYIK